MQNFTSLDPSKPLKTSIPAMQASIESIVSAFSGTAFPADNLFVGMPCWRTDEGKLYRLVSISGDGATWKLLASMTLDFGCAEKDGDGNPIGTTYQKIADANKTFVSSVEGVDAKITVKKPDGTLVEITIDKVNHAGSADNATLAEAAKKIATAITINGISFDGSANIDTRTPGTIKIYAGSSVETGYLLCDGSAVSRTAYANLFKAIGTSWGTGDGSTTFNLPNVIDRFAKGGTTSGKYQDASIPNIRGEINFPSGDFNTAIKADSGTSGALSTTQGVSMNFDYNRGQNVNNLTKIKFDASSSSSVYSDSATTVQPKSATFIFEIKT
jgi:microcystin-dependent protein